MPADRLTVLERRGLRRLAAHDWTAACRYLVWSWRLSPLQPVRVRLALESMLLIPGAEDDVVDLAVEMARLGVLTQELTRSVMRVLACTRNGEQRIERIWLALIDASAPAPWVWVGLAGHWQGLSRWEEATLHAIRWHEAHPESQEAAAQLAHGLTSGVDHQAFLPRWLAWVRNGQGELQADRLLLLIRAFASSNRTLNHAGALSNMFIEAYPLDARGWMVRGQLLLRLHEPEQARADLARARELAPRHLSVACQWALAMGQIGQADAGLSLLRGIDAPESVQERQEWLQTQATLLRRLGDLEAAQAHLQTALSWGENPALAFDLSLIELLQGQYASGFRRWLSLVPMAGSQDRIRLALSRGMRLWQGGLHDLSGLRLVVVFHQGIGDALQGARFVPALLKSAGHVALQVPDEAGALLQTLHPDLEVFEASEPLPPGDWVVDLAHLPALLGVTTERLRAMAPMPCLRADPDRVRALMLQWGPAHGLRVGICWRSHRDPLAQRSIPLAMWAAIEAPGAEWFSLQHGPLQPEEWSAARRMGLRHEGWSFDDAAAAMTLMDVVISVDTAQLHLAGSLGVRTWALISSVPDWRWGVRADHSLWYPSLTLYRQKHPTDWSGVMQKVEQALERFRLQQPKPDRMHEPAQMRQWLLERQGDPAQADRLWIQYCVQIGQTQAACQAGRQAFVLRPDDPMAARDWVRVTAQWGTDAELHQLLQALCDHASHHPHAVAPALVEASHEFSRRHFIREAIQAALHAVLAQPELPEGHVTLAQRLLDQHEIESAQRSLHNAARLNPLHDDVRLIHLQIQLLQANYEALLQGALAGWREVQSPAQLRLRGAYQRLVILALLGLGRADEAEWFRRDMLFDCFEIDDAISLGSQLLARGKWAEGWHFWRMRDRLAQYAPHTHAAMKAGARLWQEPGVDALRGQHLLVTSENGHGDTFQFGRFLPWLTRQGIRVTLQARPEAYPLLSRAQSLIPVCMPGESTTQCGPFDWVIDAHWLPAVLDVRAERLDDWGEAQWLSATTLGSVPRLAPASPGRMRVGLAWRSQPSGPVIRNLPLQLLARAGLRHVDWISLQHLPLEESEEQAARELALRQPRWNFSELATAMVQLDAVVCVDTSIAHLAGALGLPCWVLLPRLADWRWSDQGPVTPWYPQARLLRQMEPGDWQGPLNVLRQQLARRPHRPGDQTC